MIGTDLEVRVSSHAFLGPEVRAQLIKRGNDYPATTRTLGLNSLVVRAALAARLLF